MKKWLSILTVGMLSSTVIPNINIVKNDNLNEKLMINNDNQYNPTFKKVKRFRGMASKLVEWQPFLVMFSNLCNLQK